MHAIEGRLKYLLFNIIVILYRLFRSNSRFALTATLGTLDSVCTSCTMFRAPSARDVSFSHHVPFILSSALAKSAHPNYLSTKSLFHIEHYLATASCTCAEEMFFL